MTYDLANLPFQQDAVPDVCVVGAGAAGILITLHLLRAGRSVLLVESGGYTFEDATQALYRGEVTGQRHTGVNDGRFRTWGGTTTRWGGQILELESIDFVHRDWVVGSGWPITLDDLKPFYASALQLEGLGDVIREDAAVWRAAGAAVPQLGDDLEPYFTRWCPQPDFSRLHAEELASAANLTVLLHANVVDAVADGEIAQALVCRSLNGNEARIESPEFIVCIGSIETSRVLLHLEELHGSRWNPNGMVGCGFQDHIDCEVMHVQPQDRRRFFAAFTNVLLRGFKYHPKFRLNPAAQQRLGVLNVAGTMAFRDGSEEIAGAIKATGRRLLRGSFREVDADQVLHMVRYLPLLLRQAWAYTVRHRVYLSGAAAVSLRVHCEQQPDTASTVSLSGERDALGMRRVRLDWKISAMELSTIRTFLRTVKAAFGSDGLASMQPMIDVDDDTALRAACDDGLHHMGGTVMSAEVSRGVVDADLRLHGTRNLSICSASVFPTGGFSNPTHTVLALALRLATRLAAKGSA